LHDQRISDVGGLSKFVDSAALDNIVVAEAVSEWEDLFYSTAVQHLRWASNYAPCWE
jgi:hypothetical protein